LTIGPSLLIISESISADIFGIAAASAVTDVGEIFAFFKGLSPSAEGVREDDEHELLDDDDIVG
tara:strand:+ start:756 stop:947 length:192 start_codon:yes stop_codon:yes gene_type:complete